MSGDLVGLVRAACNEEGASSLPCMYPECGCQFRNHPYALSALITAAEARGAAAEREACAAVADGRKEMLKAVAERATEDERLTELVMRVMEANVIAAAIRARSTASEGKPMKPARSQPTGGGVAYVSVTYPGPWKEIPPALAATMLGAMRPVGAGGGGGADGQSASSVMWSDGTRYIERRERRDGLNAPTEHSYWLSEPASEKDTHHG